jgi:excisionase family DNA binding protein
MDKLLSAQQVADHLGLHVKTLYKLVRENRIALTFVRIHGRTMGFRPADVELFLGSHQVTRDGSNNSKPKAARRVKQPRRRNIMSDQEAQDFFAGVAIVDGVLESSS